MTSLCPSCHQKLVIEFGEQLHEEVMGKVPHRQWAGRKQACCSPVEPWDDEGVERLAQYIVRVPFSQERMNYIPAKDSPDGVAKVVYEGKPAW